MFGCPRRKGHGLAVACAHQGTEFCVGVARRRLWTLDAEGEDAEEAGGGGGVRLRASYDQEGKKQQDENGRRGLDTERNSSLGEIFSSGFSQGQSRESVGRLTGDRLNVLSLCDCGALSNAESEALQGRCRRQS
jgi:hypothetical protein